MKRGIILIALIVCSVLAAVIFAKVIEKPAGEGGTCDSKIPYLDKTGQLEDLIGQKNEMLEGASSVLGIFGLGSVTEYKIFALNQQSFISALFGGKQEWISDFCSQKVQTPSSTSSSSVVFGEQPQHFAHIEGERSKISGHSGEEFLYKITYRVEVMGCTQQFEKGIVSFVDTPFNIFIDDKQIWDDDFEGSAIAIGNSAILDYSDEDYSKVCIRFREKPVCLQTDTKELCNLITEADYKTTTPAAGNKGTNKTRRDI